jgi:hypothetical protein
MKIKGDYSMKFHVLFSKLEDTTTKGDSNASFVKLLEERDHPIVSHQ